MIAIIHKLMNLKKSLILAFIILSCIFINFKCFAVEYNECSKARIQILNKITGKVKTFDIEVNSIFNFDNKLSFIVKACYKATQKYSPEDVMFIQIAKAGPKANSETALFNNNNILNNANSYIKDLKEYHNKELAKENNSEVSTVDLTASRLIFSGWIFSNHPDISSLEDPVYDISIIKCLNN